MRHFYLVPVLIAGLACGSNPKLTPSEAESDIRKDYPVTVFLRIPNQASATKGSPEHARYVRMQEQLTQKGWFTVDRQTDSDREKFLFKPTANAPKDMQTAPKGFQIPAAQAEFVKATHLEMIQNGARVTYQIRLVKPTVHFGVFQGIYPDAHVGATKDRHAAYHRSGKDWILGETDEVFRKAD